MKVYEVEFDPRWPVPCGLLICAETKEQALVLALEEVIHGQKKPLTLDNITEIILDKPKVIFYESGDY